MANLPGRDKAEPVAAYDFLDVAEAWFMSSKIEIIDGKLFCHDRQGYLSEEDVDALSEALED